MKKRNLFQYKKEALIGEITLLQTVNDRHFQHRWNLRLLFSTFTAAFLGLSLTSKEFAKLPLEWPFAVGISLIFLLLFLAYDSFVACLMDSIRDRKDEISDILDRLPNMSCNELFKTATYVDVRKPFREKQLLKRLWEVISQPLRKRWDFGIFYILIAAMWSLGWLIKFRVFIP